MKYLGPTFHKILQTIEARKLKLQYIPDSAKFWHSLKSTDTPTIGTLIWASHEKSIPDPGIVLIG